MQPQISIIVPVYKSEQYIDRCIQSILQQTFKDFELILVDDGSPDACPRICDVWSKRDGRIKVIHKTNGGASSARNAGLAIATGNYIAFVDSDDWVHTKMYQILIDAIVSTGTQMALCDYITVNNFRKIELVDSSPRIDISIMHEVWNQEKLLNDFFRIHGENDTHSVWNRLISRQLLEGYQFIEGRMNEDIEACYQLAVKCSHAVYIEHPLYYYYVNPNGVTKSKVTLKNFDLLYMWEIISDRVKENLPDYKYACRMNQKRASFTLLSSMYMHGYDKKNLLLREKKKTLHNEVRDSFWDLMKWEMPFSRKLLLFIVCII